MMLKVQNLTKNFAGKNALKGVSFEVKRGEIYGLQHDPGRFEIRTLKPQTKLKGFYLTGQDVATAGVGGAMMGGLLCASSILKKNLMKAVMSA